MAQATEVEQQTDTAETETISKLLSDYIRISDSDNKTQAYSALFAAWGHEYTASRGSACKYANKQGLSCLHKQGNLTSVMRINRPAIFKLYDNSGKHVYALVTRLDDDGATVDTGELQIEIGKDELDRHWLGEFSLLWQKPPYYQAALQPGANGPMVQWLDQQMVRLYGHGDTPTINNTYSPALMQQVKRFQLSKGLIPDGVAGPMTFILLNTELDENTPLLTSTKDS